MQISQVERVPTNCGSDRKFRRATARLPRSRCCRSIERHGLVDRLVNDQLVIGRAGFFARPHDHGQGRVARAVEELQAAIELLRVGKIRLLWAVSCSE